MLESSMDLQCCHGIIQIAWSIPLRNCLNDIGRKGGWWEGSTHQPGPKAQGCLGHTHWSQVAHRRPSLLGLREPLPQWHPHVHRHVVACRRGREEPSGKRYCEHATWLAIILGCRNMLSSATNPLVRRSGRCTGRCRAVAASRVRLAWNGG